MTASYTNTQLRVKGDFVNLKPGQAIFGRKEWGERLNIDQYKVNRTILLFKDAEMISLFTVAKKYSIITISNWEEYQGEKYTNFAPNHTQENEQKNTQAETALNKALKAICTQENTQENERGLHVSYTHNKKVKNEKKKDNKLSSSFDENSIEYTLAVELKQFILSNNENAKVPDDLQKWSYDINKMIRLDKRSEQDIRNAIKYSQTSKFWQCNILSPAKLREKFDTLYLQQKNDKGGNNENSKQTFDKSKFLAKR